MIRVLLCRTPKLRTPSNLLIVALAVSDFVMMIDQQEVPGELMARDKARSIYEGIVRQKKDPALMEYVGYGLFKTSVFPMAIGEERDISIRYTQVLERKLLPE